eukprot:6207921-Pleurochrysis_carterae.AAC.1
MALTPGQRAAYQLTSRPPGPASFWYSLGTAVRSVGRAIDSLGITLQDDCAHIEKRVLLERQQMRLQRETYSGD